MDLKLRRNVLCVIVVLSIILTASFGVFAAEEPVTIKWWTFGWWAGITGREVSTPEHEYTGLDWPRYKAEQFQEMYPNVNIEIELLDWGKGRQKLDIVSAAGKGGPDIITEDGPNILKYAKYGAIEPIEEFLTPEEMLDYYETGLEAAYMDGKHWYFPWKFSPTNLAANRRLFDERGITNLLPSEGDRLWTYEEFVDAGKKVTHDINGDGIPDIWAYAESLKPVGLKYGIEPFMLGYGGSIFSEDGKTVVLDTPENERGLQFLVDLQDVHGVMPPGSAGLDDDQLENLWNQGNLAMRQGQAHTKYGMEAAIREGTLEEGVIDLYPIMYPSDLPEHNSKTFVVVHAIAVFKQEDDYKKQMVGEFAKFLSTPDNITEASIAGYGFPSRKSSGELYSDDEFMQYMQGTVKYGSPDFANPFYHTVSRQFITPMLQAVFSGQKTVKKALEDATRDANRYLEQQEQVFKKR